MLADLQTPMHCKVVKVQAYAIEGVFLPQFWCELIEFFFVDRILKCHYQIYPALLWNPHKNSNGFIIKALLRNFNSLIGRTKFTRRDCRLCNHGFIAINNSVSKRHVSIELVSCCIKAPFESSPCIIVHVLGQFDPLALDFILFVKPLQSAPWKFLARKLFHKCISSFLYCHTNLLW